MSKPIVLITSAAGRIGRELIARLAQEGKFTIRACYFSDSKADYLKSLGADEVVKFDLNDASTWPAALDGVTAVYSASLDPLLEGHLAFCQELGKHKAQITHVVRISCMGGRHQHRLIRPQPTLIKSWRIDSTHVATLLVGRKGTHR